VRHLRDALPDVLVIAVDRDMRVMEISGGLYGQFDRPIDTVIGQPLGAMRQRPDLARWKAAYEKALAGEPQHFDAVSTHAGRKLEIKITPLREGEAITGAIAVVRDTHEQDLARDALAFSSSRAEAILAALHEGVLVRDSDGTIVEWNQALVEMFGITPNTLRGDARWQTHDLLLPDGSPMPVTGRPGEAVRADGRPRVGIPIGFPKPDGTTQWLRLNVVPFAGPDGERWTVTSMVDETDRLAAERDLALAHARMAALLEHSNELIGVIDPETKQQWWENGTWTRIVGWDPSRLSDREMVERIHPDDVETVREALADATSRPNGTRRFMMRVRRIDDTWRYLEATFTNLTANEAVGGIVFNAHDVTDRVRVATELAEMAMHDGLTGLPNRRLVLDRIGQAIEEQRREGSIVMVLYVDLDDFKDVNDSYGHAAGDHVLVVVGNRLTACVRAIDTVGRIGGDEFVIVVVMNDEEGADSVSRHVEEALREPITMGEITIRVNASVGMVTSSPDAPRTAAELLAGADEAMYELKRRRRLRAVN
jgi:diguanylate cyclase (GGDEF)-like protein/PAS domain S-box-containing protein